MPLIEILAPAQVDQMLRDLELAAPVALRQAVPRAEQHEWLQARLPAADLAGDEAFGQRLCRHLGVRGRLRMHRVALLELVATLRDVPVPTFEGVLASVSALTGQVEKSVASQLLALFDASEPVIDRELRELLPRYGFDTLGEAPPFDQCVAYHRRLCDLFAQVITAPRWSRVVAPLDAALGPAAPRLAAARKLGLMLTYSRRTVALLASTGSVPEGTALSVKAASRRRGRSGAPRPPVRQHLCR